jgi:hypothetical protein
MTCFCAWLYEFIGRQVAILFGLNECILKGMMKSDQTHLSKHDMAFKYGKYDFLMNLIHTFT